ncbi:MAG: hypothetical protein F6J87_19825 [Spirulina sp. SIO3F2]|nr:hypothetical protein [Spirulina sp. SIO3F2]
MKHDSITGIFRPQCKRLLSELMGLAVKVWSGLVAGVCVAGLLGGAKIKSNFG